MYPRIRALREDRDMNQTQLAKLLGMSQTGYSKYETGENDIPTAILVQLARLHGNQRGLSAGPDRPESAVSQEEIGYSRQKTARARRVSGGPGRSYKSQAAQDGLGHAVLPVGGDGEPAGRLHLGGGVAHGDGGPHRPEDGQVVVAVPHGGAPVQGTP